MGHITAEDRTAAATTAAVEGGVTLMNGFVVPPDRDDAFKSMWDATSKYFIARPGFMSLRLHRAVSADAAHRWVNVANWASEVDYRAAHSTDEFRRLVTAGGWQEFPSSPTLDEVVTAVG
jgi:heme-degrading monooxygenase HmoA